MCFGTGFDYWNERNRLALRRWTRDFIFPLILHGRENWVASSVKAPLLYHCVSPSLGESIPKLKIIFCVSLGLTMELCAFATEYLFKLNLSVLTGDSEDKCFRDALTTTKVNTSQEIRLAREFLHFIRNGGPLVTMPMRSVGEIYAHMPNDVTELEKVMTKLINGGVLALYDRSPLIENALKLGSVENFDNEYFIVLDI